MGNLSEGEGPPWRQSYNNITSEHVEGERTAPEPEVPVRLGLMNEALRAKVNDRDALPDDSEVLADVVEEYAKYWGYQDHPQPDLTTLTEFVRHGCPDDALLESEKRARANLRDTWMAAVAATGDREAEQGKTWLSLAFGSPPEPTDAKTTWPLISGPQDARGLDAPSVVAYQCSVWEEAGQPEGQHPLVPLISAWFARPKLVAPETQPYGIIPRAAYDGLAPALPKREAPLPPLPVDNFSASPSMAYLPGLAPESRPGIAPPLALFDGTGLQSLTNGRGAPLALRLWLEALMCAPVEHRRRARFHLALRDVVEWLWPNDKYPRLIPDRRDALTMAFRALDQARLPWEGEYMGKWGSGWWRPVSVVSLPSVDLDSSVILDVELPPGSGNGPLVDRHILRAFGLDSAPAYRGYLNLAYIWDRRGTYGGKRVTPTRPVVHRNAAGNILDGKGRVITNRDGSPTTNWAHPRAVRTGDAETNPASERVGLRRVYTPADMVALCFPQGVGEGAANLRKYRQRARETMERMAEAGAVILEMGLNSDGAEGLRILPPPGFGTPKNRSG